MWAVANVTVWQTLRSYPKRLSWVVGTEAQLWLLATAVDMGVWLWPLVAQNGGWWKVCVTPVGHAEGQI